MDAWDELVSSLSDPQQMALQLIYRQRLEFRAVADRMGLSTQDVQRLVAGALRLVAADVEKSSPQHGDQDLWLDGVG